MSDLLRIQELEKIVAVMRDEINKLKVRTVALPTLGNQLVKAQGEIEELKGRVKAIEEAPLGGRMY